MAVAAKNWESTEWVVICDSELIRELPEETCDDNAATGPAAATRAGLEEASVWLKDLGFYGPDIETLAGADSSYKAYISDARNIDAEGVKSYGVYDEYERKLYMSSDYYFALGRGSSEEERESDLALNMPAIYSMVHELFHGVQHSYHQGEVYRSQERDWIWEGTADAIKIAWQGKRTGSVHGYARSYEYPLHQPRDRMEAYETAHFWTSLGEVLDSRDRVQYLDHLLQQDLSASRGLAGIDAGLERWRAEGLYDLYPAVIAKHVRQDAFFDDVTEHALSFPEDEATIQGQTVRPVATRAHRVRVDVPAGKTAGLKITFDHDDRPDLHLIVDGARQDKPGATGRARNVYQGTLHESTELLVRVANIAKHAPASSEQRYDLKLELRPLEPCGLQAMEASAADNVGMMAGTGPADAALDNAPLSGAAQDFVEQVRRAFRRPGASILPGEGSLTIRGLVNDGGVGCSGHLAATTLFGRSMADTAADAPEDAQMAEVEEQLDKLDEVMGESGSEMSPEDLAAAARHSQQMLDAFTAPEPGKPNDVVLPVYSPHVSIWQAGLIRDSEHSGIGGWQPNAAAQFVLLLPGTSPEDLKEGETFDAVAEAPQDSGGDGMGPVSPASFYSRWSGRFVEIPVPPNTALTSVGNAFEGIKEHLYGRLTGTVTIEKITGPVIEGRFRLSGNGTLVKTEYMFDCDEVEVYPPGPASICDEDERLSGSLRVSGGETTQSGPITIEGRLFTPNRSAGGGVRHGYQNIVID